MLMSTKNHIIRRFLNCVAKNSDMSSQSSPGILGFRAGQVEPGPDLALVTSRAGRVE